MASSSLRRNRAGKATRRAFRAPGGITLFRDPNHPGKMMHRKVGAPTQRVSSRKERRRLERLKAKDQKRQAREQVNAIEVAAKIM